MTPQISILMAAYNAADFIEQAIESVLAQTFRDWELIVSDNASTDGTADIVARLAAQDERIRLFCNETNVGAEKNFNLCYQRTDPHSPYFIMLPADDWWLPEALERLWQTASANPDVAVTYSDIYRTDATGNALNTYFEMLELAVPPPGKHQAVRELYETNYIPAQTALISRQWFQQLFPWNGPLFEELSYANDYFLFLVLASRGGLMYALHDVLGYYRKHDGALTMPQNILPRLHNNAKVFDLLEEFTPPGLEAVRLQQLSNWLAKLGFAFVESGCPHKARPVLRQAANVSPSPRLDLKTAHLIASLPLPVKTRALLWRMARTANSLLPNS